MPLKRVKLESPGLREDLRKLGVGLILAAVVGWLLQNGSFNALYAVGIGFFLWLSGLIRFEEGE